MGRIKVWPHATLILIGCAVLAAVAAILWTRYERSAEAKDLMSAARIERVDGQVSLNHGLDGSANGQWVDGVVNTPISIGDRVVTRDNSRTEIAFTGRNSATLEANTSLDVLELADQRTQVALRNGSAMFEIGELESGELFEIATPCGAVDLKEPGLYQIAVDENRHETATTLKGRAELVGKAGAGVIEKGNTLSIPCQGDSAAVLSRVDAGQAGTALDTYYRYRYPRRYDGRYANYYTYDQDPDYFDPYHHDISYQYVSDYIPGVDDLDQYGSWEYISDYGYCWHPYVETSWAPYQYGNWDTVYPFGVTWISSEPWGYAPYHYGRWAYVSDRWFWIPEGRQTRPAYSPAMVAFVYSNQTNSIAWIPLGPGDPYVPRYYDSNWNARFLARESSRARFFNQDVPAAVTVVSIANFNQHIDNTVILRNEKVAFANARPLTDPMSVAPVRRAALEARAARHKVSVPGDAQRMFDTPVVASATPRGRPFSGDLARALRVESVPAPMKNRKLQFKDETSTSASLKPGRNQVGANAGAETSGNVALEQQRERRMLDLSKEASRGNRAARQELRSLQREQAARPSLPTVQPVIGPPQQRRARDAGTVQAERVGKRVERVPQNTPQIRAVPRPEPLMRPQVRPQAPAQIRPAAPTKTKPPEVRAEPQRLPPVRIKPPQHPNVERAPQVRQQLPKEQPRVDVPRITLPGPVKKKHP